MHKRKSPVRDIYHGHEQDLEKDFTPQIATERQAERLRDLRRTQILALSTGIVLILFAVTLATVVIYRLLKPKAPAEADGRGVSPSAAQALPEKALWVMDYQLVSNEVQNAESAGRSAEQLKTAAYHIFSGQQEVRNPDQALDHFQKALDIYPDILGLHERMGLLYLAGGDYGPAAVHFEKALLEKETFDKMNGLASAYTGLKEYDKAEQQLKRALELRPEDADCHKNLADLYQKMNRENDAAYHFQKYIDMRPDDFDTMQDYGLYLFRLGRWKEAADLLTNLSQKMINVAPVYFLLAQAQIQNGQPDLAIKALQSGAQLIDPQVALSWMNRPEFASLRTVPEFRELLNQLKTGPAAPAAQ